jgi:hypothetical protein
MERGIEEQCLHDVSAEAATRAVAEPQIGDGWCLGAQDRLKPFAVAPAARLAEEACEGSDGIMRELPLEVLKEVFDLEALEPARLVAYTR